MRTTRTGLSIVLAVAIGAAITWFWMSRSVVPVVRPTSQPQSVVPHEPAPPEVPDNPRSPAVASVTSPIANAIAPARDDSTYDRMLAFAQSEPLSESTARDLIEKRERFLFTPDDPDWGRRTEQALRNALEAKTAGGGSQITSVSCRSAGCEVQALSQPFCGGTPCELWVQGERRAGPDNVDPVAPFRTDWPGGLPLRRQALIVQHVGDRSGVIVTYSREAGTPERSDPPSEP
jgi:hypothetical protein